MAQEDRRSTAPPAAARTPGPEPIKVRELRTRGADTNLPPPAKSGMLVAGTRATGEVVTIQYEPWHRHHRVREIDGDKIVREVCIPESWVAYTPDPEGWGSV